MKNFEAIIHISGKIMMENQFSDKTFETFFKTHKFFSADKAFIVNYVYHLVRNWRLFSEIRKNVPGTKCEVTDIFCISWILAGNPVFSVNMFKPTPKELVIKLYSDLQVKRAIRYSIPDWIDELGSNSLGKDWPGILSSLNKDPHLTLRTNTLKISSDELSQRLLSYGIKTKKHPEVPEALILGEKANVFQLPEFKEGLFEMQDLSSQITGRFTQAEPGMRVIDGCAGNGGKTLHMAGLMNNKGKILALDIYASKLETLKKRARRAGVSIVETREITSTKVVKRLYNSADLVLLDVPCSGLGVLKRNPEIKWNLLPCDVENLKKTQQEILNRYSQMVKPGGKLVYSTCSILPDENAGQIGHFLQKNHNFELMAERSVSPTEGFDGFYMASLKRLA